MVRKVFEKAGMIPGLDGEVRPSPTPAPSTERIKPKTAPGTMMSFLTAQSEAIHETEQLKDRVKELESSPRSDLLDPATIRASRWANRHESSFATAEFDEFKAEIRAAGRNVQPIKVRPVSAGDGASAEGVEGFEIIFGHKRHRACLELGIPVLAIIEQATDVSLFEQMERENRGRKNLSAWEQGSMYRRALDEGLYPSLRRLAESLNVDVSLVSKGVTLARLPDEVVAAFQSPLDIQFRWATPLAEAVKKNAEATLATARALASDRGRMVPTVIFSKLIGEPAGVLNGSTADGLEIRKAGKKVAVLSSDAKGRAVIRFELGVLPDERRAELASLIESFLKT